MALDQKAMGVLKLYLRDYPIEDGKWHLFDKWGVQQQPWAVREGKKGYVYRYVEDGSGLVRAVIVSYYDPPEPIKPGAKKKREAMEDDDAEKPAARVLLPYLNVVTWHPEAQDEVNHYLRETYHFFHPEGNGRFISGFRRGGVSHWTEEESPLRSSSDGLDAFVRERLREIRDEKVKAALQDVHESAPPAEAGELTAGLEAIFESTDYIRPYWKTLDIYEMPGPFHPALFSAKA
ncbi:MAG: hypothetical protein ACE5IM_01095 [Nitrospinota bacterium]